jgi:hypothetical protein
MVHDGAQYAFTDEEEAPDSAVFLPPGHTLLPLGRIIRVHRLYSDPGSGNRGTRSWVPFTADDVDDPYAGLFRCCGARRDGS